MRHETGEIGRGGARWAVAGLLPLLLLLLVGCGLLSGGSGSEAPAEAPPEVATEAPAEDTTDATSEADEADEAAETGGGAAVRIENDSDESICRVFLSPTATDEWGNEQLGGRETLAPGDAYTFEVSAGAYDIRLEDCERNMLLEERDVQISGQYDIRFTGSDMGNAELLIANDSQQTICYVYFSPTQSEEWGGDRLGMDEKIEPGDERLFAVETGSYDILLNSCDETTLLEEYEVSVSGTYELRFSP